MLVVADELAGRISRKGSLAGARKAKEDRGGIGGRVHIGRAMHGKHVVFNRQQVVHGREDALFDLSGIAGARHQNHALLEVDDHRHLGVGAMGCR